MLAGDSRGEMKKISIKLLSLIHYGYYCIYSFIMKTPSKDLPHTSSSIIVALIIYMHSLTFLFLSGLLDYIEVVHGSMKLFLIIALILLIVGSGYYFDWKKNGEKIVKAYPKKKKGENKSIVIGFLIVIETLFLPIFIGIFFFHR